MFIYVCLSVCRGYRAELAFAAAKAADVAIDEQLRELAESDALQLPLRLLESAEDEALVRERGMSILEDTDL